MRSLRTRRRLAQVMMLLASVSAAAALAAVTAFGSGETPWPKPPVGSSWQGYFGIQNVPDVKADGPAVFTPKPDHTYFYTNSGTGWGATNTKNSVVIFDTTDMTHWTLAAISNIPDAYSVGYSSHAVGVSPDGSQIYLPSMGGGPGKPPLLLVLDGRTLLPQRIFKSTLGGFGGHHVNNFTGPDGNQYMMALDFNWNFGGAGVYVMDPAKNNDIVGGMTRADFSGNPYLLSEEYPGNAMYATVPAALASLRGKMDGALDKIDTTTWKVTGAVPLRDPIWVEPTQDGKTAWVTLGDPGKVAKVDTATMQVLDEVTTGPGPYGARLSCDETQLFVADKGEASGYSQRGRTITVIDAKNDVVTDVIPTGRTVDHLILSPDCKYLVASSNADHNIWVYDVATHKRVGLIKMPNNGDPHSGTFVQFKGDGNGGVVGEVVSSLVGLRGSARVAQQAQIQAAKSAVDVVLSPKNAAGPAALTPSAVAVRPGQTVSLRFSYPVGTSARPADIQTSGGVKPFTLQPGAIQLVTFTAPPTPGQILFTWAAAPVPLTVNVTNGAPAPRKPGKRGTKVKRAAVRTIRISAKGDQFDLKALTLKAGTTVKFVLTNGDDEPHNLIDPTIGLTHASSPDASGGKSVTFTWKVPKTPGTHKVICTYHPWMVIDTTIQS